MIITEGHTLFVKETLSNVHGRINDAIQTRLRRELERCIQPPGQVGLEGIAECSKSPCFEEAVGRMEDLRSRDNIYLSWYSKLVIRIQARRHARGQDIGCCQAKEMYVDVNIHPSLRSRSMSHYPSKLHQILRRTSRRGGESPHEITYQSSSSKSPQQTPRRRHLYLTCQ